MTCDSDRCFQQIFSSQIFEGQNAKKVLNAFTEIVNKSKRKPNKLWVGKEENFTIALCKNA